MPSAAPDAVDSENNLQFEIDDIHKSFDTNVIGVLNTVNSFLPLVRKSKLKQVVTISSAMGDLGKSTPILEWPSGHATKAKVSSQTSSTRLTLAMGLHMQ